MATLVVSSSWDALLDGESRTRIERDLLPPFLARQRWFGGKARPLRAARFLDWGVLAGGAAPQFITLVGVDFADGGDDRYFLPLACGDERDRDRIEREAPRAILAALDGPRHGVLYDAWLDDRFSSAILTAFDTQATLSTARGVVRIVRSSAFAESRGTATDLPVRRMSAEQSNTSLVYGDRLILKLVRRAQPGVNPDFEIGRQIADHTPFRRVPPMVGALEYVAGSEPPTTLGMLQELVRSEGDGWTHATAAVVAFLQAVGGMTPPATTVPARLADVLTATPPSDASDHAGTYVARAGTLGRRTAEMHLALASDATRDAFAPEAYTAADLAADASSTRARAEHTLQTLSAVMAEGDRADRPLAPDAAALGRTLLQSADALFGRIRSVESLGVSAAKIRIHGDYHLGQVLTTGADFFILDFEGEPARPLAERRRKQSPLKDVAGMVRSYGYAAHAGLLAAPARPGGDDTMERWSRLWQTWATASFLRGYFAAAAGATFLPAIVDVQDALLRLFTIEKALYELEYELNNRPDWVRIPLRGILTLI